jgi:hypothetical protein
VRRPSVEADPAGGPEWTEPIARPLREAIAWVDTLDQPFFFDPDARELWGQIYTALAVSRPGLIGAVTSRGEAQVLRLALLYAVLDCSILVRAWHLEAAREVWRYCEDSAVYLFHGKAADPDAEKVVRALTEAPGGLTRTQIHGRVFGGNRKADFLDAVFTRLIRRGLVRRVVVPTGGRSAERWELAGGTA